MPTLFALAILLFLQGAIHAEPPTITGEGATQLRPADIDAILTLCKRLYPDTTPALLKCAVSRGTLSWVGVFYAPTESSDRFFRGSYLSCFRQPPSYKQDSFDFIVEPWVLRSKEQLIRTADNS